MPDHSSGTATVAIVQVQIGGSLRTNPAPSNLPCKFGIATAVRTLTPAVWYLACRRAYQRLAAGHRSRGLGARPGLSAALVGTAAQAELGVREAEHGRRARTRSPIQHQKHSDADRIPRRSRVRAACWM